MEAHFDKDREEALKMVASILANNEPPYCGIVFTTTGPGPENFVGLGGCPLCRVKIAVRIVALVCRDLRKRGVPPETIQRMFDDFSKQEDLIQYGSCPEEKK